MPKPPKPRPTLNQIDLDILEAAFRSVTDASAFDDMVDAWESRFATMRASSDGKNNDAALSERLAVVSQIFESMKDPAEQADPIEHIVSYAKSAAFVSTSSGEIISANDAAKNWFDASVGGRLTTDWLECSARNEFETVRKSCTGKSNRRHAILRISAENGEAALAEIYILSIPSYKEGLLVVRLLELSWDDSVSALLEEAFDLTPAEVEISRLLLLHRDTAQIAEIRGGSVLTVRTQLRSIFDKTGTVSQVDLVRLLSMICARFEQQKPAIKAGWRDPLEREEHFFDTDGRKICFSWMGKQGGIPAIMVHGTAAGHLLPYASQQILAERGIQLFSIIRPGFGNSDPAPLPDPLNSAARAIGALQNHLGLKQCVAVAISSGAIPLIRYASQNRAAISHILCIGGFLPLHRPSDLSHLPKYQRVIFKMAALSPWASEIYFKAGYQQIRKYGVEWYLRRLHSESPCDLAVLDDVNNLPLIRAGAELQFAQGTAALVNEIRMIAADWDGDLTDEKPGITILHGAHDRFYPAHKVAALAAGFPHISVEILEECGELIAFQRPDLVAKKIADLCIS
ncbi:alpha/beta fold hydrolase [Sphingorhabdus arenilitoris]|uniref:Alpha/beta fold hydrolase n=1 Tax=Sphingorhabdus arenilitoris TaxID=1490041 RepID=A0ABV8RDH5_9SPHN